jgi:hypothetical protein
VTTTKPPVLTDDERPNDYPYFTDWFAKDAPMSREVTIDSMARHAWLAGVRFADLFPKQAVLARAGADAVREWQPIATAPTDGGQFMVFTSRIGYSVVVNDAEDPLPVTDDNPSGLHLFVDDGKHGPYPIRGDYPTHWMALPPPPVAIRALKGTPAAATCVCGNSATPGVVHRTDGPCYHAETPAAAVADAQPNEAMFLAAVRDLARVSEALNLEPHEGGAAPILDAIAALRRERDEWVDAGYAAQPSAQAQPSGDFEQMRHIANEWADMATNGLQWVRNIYSGISKPEDALKSLNTNMEHCRKVNDAFKPQPSGNAGEVADAEYAARGRAIDRACIELPPGWDMRIDLERDAGLVYAIDPDGNEQLIDSADSFSDQMNTAVDAAIAASKGNEP